jgi:hypothetical protein
MARGKYRGKLPKKLYFIIGDVTPSEISNIYYGPYGKKPTTVLSDYPGVIISFELSDDEKTYKLKES